MSYATVPRVYATPAGKASLQSALLTARSTNLATPVRMVVDGDSQELCPGGQGKHWLPLFNWHMWGLYGNSPESQILAAASYGGGSPYAGWGVRGSLSTNASADFSSADPTLFPYNVDASGLRVRTNDNQSGYMIGLQPTLATLDPAITEIDRTSIEYITRSGLKVNVFVPHCVQHHTLAYWCSFAVNQSTPAFFNTPRVTGTIDIADCVVADGAWSAKQVNFQFGATPPTSGNLLTSIPQFRVVGAGTTAGVLAEPASANFQSANSSGITLHSFALGGKRTQDQPTDRPLATRFHAAIQTQVILIATGTNDLTASTAAQYAANVFAKIDWYRADGIDATFVIMIEADRNDSLNRAQWALYADAIYDELLARPTEKLVMINRRRILEEEYNWVSGSAEIATYLDPADVVHYSLAGARLVAQEDVNALFLGAGLSTSFKILGSEQISTRVDSLGLNLKR